MTAKGDLNLHEMTPFEWTMTSRVSKSPMEFIVMLQCFGSVDCAKFNQALLLEINRHPLLRANAEIGPNHRQSFWRISSESAPQINWFETEYSPEQGFPAGFEPIDLRNEIGLRFYGWRCKSDLGSSVVMKFVFHHACCDGKAGLDFAEQTLIKYGSLCAGCDEGTDAKIAIEHSRDTISDRNTRAGRKLNVANRLFRSIVVRPKRVIKFLFQRPVLLNCQAVDCSKVDLEKLYDSPPLQCTFTFDERTTKSLGEFSKSRNSTTNLVLARELFHTLNEREDDAGDSGVSEGSSRRGRFRLMIPYSLREDRRHQVQVANCVSIVYLEATQRSIAQDSLSDPVLLNDLGRQMFYIRRWQLQYSWIESIESYARFWPLLKLLKKRKPSEDGQQSGLTIATAAMTNLGRAFKNQRWADNGGKIKVASLEVETVHVAVPCTEKLNTNFSVNFYRDRLTLDIIYLPSLVSREAAQSILDTWTQRISRLVELE